MKPKKKHAPCVDCREASTGRCARHRAPVLTAPPAERSITVADLPTATVPGVTLYCPSCQEHYSATQGDYFWMPPAQVFRCTQCETRLQLVRRHRAPLTPWSKDEPPCA